MSHFSVLVIGDDVPAALAPFQENNMGDCPVKYLEFIEDEDCDFDPKNGKRGYWENPNAKWDYWSIGGRYSGSLKIEGDSGEHNSGLAAELDFDAMRQMRGRLYANCYDDAKKAVADKMTGETAKFIYGVNPEDQSKDDYVSQADSEPPIRTFAVLMDGKWYERDNLGWFACVSDEKSADQWNGEFEGLLRSLEADDRVTVVDCHI